MITTHLKFLIIGLLILPIVGFSKTLTVGSKMDTEGQVLAEIVSQVIENTGEATVIRKYGMGGTGIVYESLKNGYIDIYPEYTGTIWNTIIKKTPSTSAEELSKLLSSMQLMTSGELGFNNTYGLAMRESQAEELGIQTISDLSKNANQIKAGFTPEFLNFEGNYPKLKELYKLKLKSAKTLNHSLAYEALNEKQIDLIDVYTTDAKINRFKLTILMDDLAFFPKYHSLFLVKSDFKNKFPKSWAAIQDLTNKISESQMIALNARAEIDKVSFKDIASDFLKHSEAKSTLVDKSTFSSFQKRFLNKRLLKLTGDHLFLVVVSLLAAILFGIPLGICAYLYPRPGHFILATCGVVQTIPSLALLCFMIPWFGIGVLPALFALFLYSLLPIVQGTYSGLTSLSPRLLEMAQAMRLTSRQTLLWACLPLSRPAILNGIKVSAVINVGTATLAVFVGGGGGAYIVMGLALNDTPMILNGAIPAGYTSTFIKCPF